MRGWRRCWTISASMSAPRPYLAPAVLCSIGDMQASEGVWYPKGGTRAVAEGLAKLAADARRRPAHRRRGDRLRIEDGAIKAVRTAGGERIACDAVISNMDAIRTYKELVGGDAGRKYAKKGFEPACSGVVLYLGLKQALRPPGAPLLRLLPRRGGGVRRDLQAGRAGARPDRLPRRAVLLGRHRGAGGRRGAVRAGPHPLPAARATTGRRCSRPTARPSSTS